MKEYYQNEIMMILNIIPERYDKKVNSVSHADSTNKCWLCEKELKREVDSKKALSIFD